MKTIEVFINEIERSAALQDEFKAIQDKDALTAFLKKHDVEGTALDFGKAIKEKYESEGEISDDTAEAVAGGERISWGDGVYPTTWFVREPSSHDWNWDEPDKGIW